MLNRTRFASSSIVVTDCTNPGTSARKEEDDNKFNPVNKATNTRVFENN